jgi:hypothetical protein
MFSLQPPRLISTLPRRASTANCSSLGFKSRSLVSITTSAAEGEDPSAANLYSSGGSSNQIRSLRRAVESDFGPEHVGPSEDALIVITSAIKTAFIDHPGSGHGTTWDQVTKSDEESIHLAKAVLVALRKAGYSVTKIEDQNAPKP